MSPGGNKRQLTLSGDDDCSPTCYGYTCDHWAQVNAATTCSVMENTYNCDCSGCCAPTSVPTRLPTTAPTASPAPTVAHPSPSPTVAHPSSSPTAVPAFLMVSGACDKQPDIDDVYAPVGTTLDGRWYYKGHNHGGMLYFDQDCNGGTSSPDRWIIDDAGTEVSTTAAYDLDGDGSCSYSARIYNDGADPPLGTNAWRMDCGHLTEADLTIIQVDGIPSAAPTTAPTISQFPTLAHPTLPPTLAHPTSSPTSCFCFIMMDGWGDGWEGSKYIFRNVNADAVVATGTLDSGAQGTDDICLSSGCYMVRVTNGEFSSDITWAFGALSGGCTIRAEIYRGHRW